MTLLMLGSTVAFADPSSFDLWPLRNGDSVRTEAVKKLDTASAVANITPQHYLSYLGDVYMRVRTGEGTAAGTLVSVGTNGKQYLPYWAGYNTVNSYRRLYCNYVSDSTYYGGVIIEGIWEP